MRVYENPKRRVAEQRRRYREKLRARGICIVCFTRKIMRGINPKTNKKYSLCGVCNRKSLVYCRKIRDKRKHAAENRAYNARKLASDPAFAEKQRVRLVRLNESTRPSKRLRKLLMTHDPYVAEVWLECCLSSGSHRKDCREARERRVA